MWHYSIIFTLSSIFSLLGWTVLAEIHVHDQTFTPDHILRVQATNYSINCQSRYSVIVNETSPGPPLHLIEGQITWIRVYNDIKDLNLTIHWHGLTQSVAPFSDGTPQVSQWPIPPGHFFDYEIFPDTAGTYFYHSHVGFQAVSAFGPLIVRDKTPGYHKYDDELLISIADYFNKTDKQIEDGLLANPFVWSGETNAILMNGYSGSSSPENATDASCAPLVLTVQPDTLYRIRFIGATALSLVTLGVEDHTNLTIIEADGAVTQPYETDHLQVASGQRFSILLKTKSQVELQGLNKTSFWIRYENRERPANVSGYAILAYNVSGSSTPKELPLSSPVTLPLETYDWLEYALQPIDPFKDPFPSKADRTVKIQVHQFGTYVNNTFKSTLEWGENGDIWQPERIPVPYLVSFYLNGESSVPNYTAALSNNGWDLSTLAFPAKIGEVVDIIWESNNLPTGGWDIHSFHAHGKHYWDLGSGNNTYNETENEQRLKGYNPLRRDTTMLYRYASNGALNTTAGWRAWRLKFDEAGAFMMHCHMLQHAIMGRE
jgi:L-ascorbate oxidase